MKTLKLILLLSILTFSLKAQTELAEEKIIDYKHIISNLYEFKKMNFNNYLIRVYIYDNGSGSAKLESSDESSTSILISKSEYGESEIPKFYIIRDLLNFKIKSIKEAQIEIKDKNTNKTIQYTY